MNLSFPISHANFLSPTSLVHDSKPPPKPAMSMFSHKPVVEEPDNVILHEPWPMPENVGPNHCAPGSSILIQPEEEAESSTGRPRRFSILGGRRSSRASSVGSSSKGRRSFSEGLAGGKLFDSNPFSFSDVPTCAAEIKPPTAAERERSGSPSSLQQRESSLRFGALPHRPPELKRASSITIGVLSRGNMLAEQNGGGGGGGPPRRAPIPRPVVSSEPEPVDLGVVVKSGAKKLWGNVRSSISSSPSSSSRASDTSPARSSSSLGGSPARSPATSLSPAPSSDTSSRRSASPNPSIPDSVPPPAPSEEFAKPRGGMGLTAVTEESGSGAATPIAGRGGSSLGLENLHLKLEGVTSTPPAQGGNRYREWSRSPPASPSDITRTDSPSLRHPDPSKRAPSPPPRPADREGAEEEAERTEVAEALRNTGTAEPSHGPRLHRSASFGANDYAARGEEKAADMAERIGRNETRESAIMGYQRRVGD